MPNLVACCLLSVRRISQQRRVEPNSSLFALVGTVEGQTAVVASRPRRVTELNEDDIRGGRTARGAVLGEVGLGRSEEHTSELQSLMRISYAVFCLNKKNNNETYMINPD